MFDKLDLNRLGFQLDWKEEENGIASIRYVLEQKIPKIMKRYEKIGSLNPQQIAALQEDIYALSKARLDVWGLGGAMDKRKAPYFEGSHIVAL